GRGLCVIRILLNGRSWYQSIVVSIQMSSIGSEDVSLRDAQSGWWTAWRADGPSCRLRLPISSRGLTGRLFGPLAQRHGADLPPVRPGGRGHLVHDPDLCRDLVSRQIRLRVRLEVLTGDGRARGRDDERDRLRLPGGVRAADDLRHDHL